MHGGLLLIEVRVGGRLLLVQGIEVSEVHEWGIPWWRAHRRLFQRVLSAMTIFYEYIISAKRSSNLTCSVVVATIAYKSGNQDGDGGVEHK